MLTCSQCGVSYVQGGPHHVCASAVTHTSTSTSWRLPPRFRAGDRVVIARPATWNSNLGMTEDLSGTLPIGLTGAVRGYREAVPGGVDAHWDRPVGEDDDTVCGIDESCLELQPDPTRFSLERLEAWLGEP